jgi:hypothetical protein
MPHKLPNRRGLIDLTSLPYVPILSSGGNRLPAYAHDYRGNHLDNQTLVNADSQTGTEGNTGRGKGVRKPKPKTPGEPKGKRSLNLSMPIEDYERFMLHAMKMTNGNISELVCKLGREHLRDYHITRTPNRDGA